jgi:ubiquinol-cytochrome c reductase cytochrome c subunit
MIKTVVLALALGEATSAPAAVGQSGNQPPAPPVTAAANAENGKRLYMKHTCYYCHGTVGQGSIAGVRVAVVARNLQGFTRYVRQPAGAMPAYTDKILSDAELADMFAYLRALPAAKPASEIPLLEQLKAKP